MPDDSTPPVVDYEALKKRPQAYVKAPNFVSVYSNSMNAEATFNDVKLFFGEIVEASKDRLEVEQKVSIIMSPEQAKSALKALATTVKSYEDAFGPIRDSPGGD